MNDLCAQCMKTNIFVFIRYWRSTLSATENGFWPHWGTGYTKTPHRNLHGPSPYGWVSESLQADSMGFTHDNIEQYLNQLGFKLSWLYKTVVPFPDGSLFLWGKFSLPTAAVTTQMITQISRRGAKWPSHCRFLPADLSWMLLTMNWLSRSHHSHTPISRFFQAQRKPENLEAVLKQPAVPKHVFL